MKKILITGAGSYIGTSFENYLKNFAEEYAVDTLDMTNDLWQNKDFADYDAVFHVAGIAHSDIKNVTEAEKALYYKVNTELTEQTALKARADGAKQFIFMSSAIVYGESAPIGKQKIITQDTEAIPANFYGDSKLQAEKRILPLQTENFNVVVLRPPMIYGKGSKGNYPFLRKVATKIPFFPYVENQRSMLYIENLCEFVRLMIDNEESGVFHPQNGEYSNTSQMVKLIAEVHGKKNFLLKGFSRLLKIISRFTGLVNKAFGNFVYDMAISDYKENYRLYGIKESIERTEK